MKMCVDCSKEIKAKNKSNIRCYSCSNKIRYKDKEHLKNMKESIRKSRKKELNYDGDLYDLDKLKDVLKNFDINKYTGSGKNRTFYKNEPKIMFSLKKHSNHLALKYSYINRCILSDYTLVTKGIDLCICSCKKTLKWDYSKKSFQKAPKCCKLGPNSIERKILEHGEEKGKIIYEEFCKKNGEVRKGFLSLEYFKEKYDTQGQEEYDKYWQFNFSKRKQVNFSKISQELFNSIIINKKIDKSYVRFATFNDKGEVRINFNKKDKELIGESRVCMYLDFVYKDKVIEFDGAYWHRNSEEHDKIRDEILKNKGYKILRIKEKYYKKDKNKEIEKCSNFLINP